MLLLCFPLPFLVGRPLAHSDLFECSPFRFHPHVRVAREHGARDIAGAGFPNRRRAEWLIAASHCKHKTYTHEKRIIALIGGTLGGRYPCGASPQ
jgi:hypothetical protein